MHYEDVVVRKVKLDETEQAVLRNLIEEIIYLVWVEAPKDAARAAKHAHSLLWEASSISLPFPAYKELTQQLEYVSRRGFLASAGDFYVLDEKQNNLQDFLNSQDIHIW